jgi:Inner membrane component of T3SS, cytoplasmic domain
MAVCLQSSLGMWILPEGRSLIGRGDDCAVRIVDVRLSRQHAEIAVRGVHVVISDRGSANGVLVGGERIDRPTAILPGDILVCGPVRFEIIIDEDAAPPQAQHIGISAHDHTETGTLRALLGRDQRGSTEEMDPQRIVRDGLVQPSPGLDPGIAAALGVSASDVPAKPRRHDTPSERHRREGSTSIRPSDLVPAITATALAPHVDRASGAQPVYRAQPSAEFKPHDPDVPTTTALSGASQRRVRQRRIIAGVADPLWWCGIALALGLLIGAMGSVGALRWASVAIVEQRVVVDHPQPAGWMALAHHVAVHLLSPSGWAQANDVARTVRQRDAGGPFLLLFAVWVGALVVAELTLLIGLAWATAQRGAPWWHRRHGLLIVTVRHGHHPGWLRSACRWLALGLTWPAACVTAALGRRGLHDLISGCEVRSR